MKEVALVGLSLSFFFVTILLLKRDKHLKDFLLIGFFMCIGCELLYRFLLFGNSYYYHSRFVLLDIVYWAVFGPILLYYIKSVIVRRLRFKLTDLLNLLPLIISLATVSDYFFNKSFYNSFSHFYNLQTGIFKIGLNVWEFSSPVYLVYATVILIKHKRNIKNYFSNIERKELNWLFLLTIGFTAFIYITYSLWIFSDFLPLSLSLKILTVVLSGYVFVLGVYGYRQESIFLEMASKSDENNQTDSKRRSYQKTFLDPDERELINQKLMNLMQQEKPYLESEITISDLASRIGISVYKLSRVINEDHNHNFFDFINTYRVNEVKHLLTSSKTNSSKIESIAYDCGFNSKSSFYSIFKKHTHLTPTEFKEKFLVNSKSQSPEPKLVGIN
jgi:AraC-like DNA-binding protein